MTGAATAEKRPSGRWPRDRDVGAIALAALATAAPLALLLLVNLGGSPAAAPSPPAARAAVATAAISILGAMAAPAARPLAGLAALHLALLGLVALAGGGIVVQRVEPGASFLLAIHAWLDALTHAWLGTAAVVALGYGMQDRALRRRKTAVAMRLPAIAVARRLLGILLVAGWLTTAAAGLVLGAASLRGGLSMPLVSEGLASLAVVSSLSILLAIDAVRGSSARQRAQAALLAYALFVLTRVAI